MDFIKKNKLIVGIVAVVLVVVLLGGYFFFLKGSNQGGVANQTQEEQTAKQISADEVGLILDLKPDGKAIILTLTKLEGIKSFEYELSYDAEETSEGETAMVPKGVVGGPVEIDGKSSIEREVLLGTCSANVCRYDKISGPIKVILKINFDNGEVGIVEDTINLE